MMSSPTPQLTGLDLGTEVGNVSSFAMQKFVQAIYISLAAGASAILRSIDQKELQ